MKPDPNYPRMMFHPRQDPVTVYSEEQEAALGREWSRTIVASLPREEKPVKPPEPEPEEEPWPEDPDEEPEEPPLLKEPEPEPEKIRAHQSAPPAKRARPAAHKPPPHKRKA